MTAPDFAPLAEAIVAWKRAGAPSLASLPPALAPAIDAVLRERAYGKAIVLSSDPSLRQRPRRDDFARSDLWKETRQRWVDEYYFRSWLRLLASWADDLAKGVDPGGVLHARLRFQLDRDLEDLARRSNPPYQYARQQLNKVLAAGGYGRTEDHRIAAVGRDPATLPKTPDELVERIHATLPLSGGDLGKAERAKLWVEHWFTTAPDHQVALWRLTHEMLWAFEHLDEAPSGQDLPAADLASVAHGLLRKLRVELGADESEQVLLQIRDDRLRALEANPRFVAVLRETCNDYEEARAVLRLIAGRLR